MEKVDIKIARACVAEYEATMKKLGITSPAEGLTNSVGFPGPELLKWMQGISNYMTELRVVFGVYTKELSPENAGRFTVFLWPYNEDGEPAKDEEGEEVPPVNVGDLLP